jgi:hypothetical protein
MKAASRVISYFDLGEDAIRVETSILSGREWVYLNEKLVSNKLSWRFKTVHPLTVQGKAVEVVVSLSGRFCSSIQIELWVEGALKDSDEWDLRRMTGTAPGQKKPWPLMTTLLIIFLSGIGWAYLGYKLATWLYGG